MLEFEFNTPVEAAVLVEFFARCGWSEEDAGAKLEWALAASDQWVLCKLDGEVIGFGRSSLVGPLKRVVFDVLVDSRFQGRGLRLEIVRLLSQSAGRFEEVSVFSERDAFPLKSSNGGDTSPLERLPLASPGTYLGKRHNTSGGGNEQI
jgi:hypothetical protein